MALIASLDLVPLHSDLRRITRLLLAFRFYGMLDGMERYQLDHDIQFHGVQSRMESIRVTGKLGFSNHPMLEHFKFLKAHT